MFKKLDLFDYLNIIGTIIVILLGVYYYFLFPKLEKRIIKHEISSIVDKINNYEQVTIKKRIVKGDNKIIYDSIISYLEEISSNTNYINGIYKDKEFIDILIIDDKDFNKKKEYINNTKNELDKKVDLLRKSNKYEYIGKLDDNSISLINNYYMDVNIDKNKYDDKYNNINSNIEYINKTINLLESNNEKYDIDNSKIIFKKRSLFNSYEEIIKNREGIIVKTSEYELIKDENPPSIEASDITIYTGNNINLNSKVKCIDDVDDEVECNISGDYNVNKVGTYTINISAKDASGNESSKSIKLNVKTYAVQNNGKPYYIEIVRNQNVVIVYGLDSNNYYTRVVKVFVASVGRPGAVTPTGTFKTSRELRWATLYGGVYGQYTTRIVGAILFHSVPYYSQNPGDLEWEEYNKLGSAVSAGCVRLRVIDAKWIYDNVPSGTTVRIYDGNLPNGVGKPSAAKISGSNPNRGWDPTDPDPNNPWK